MFIECKIPYSNFYFSQLCPWQQSTEDTISKMEVLDLSWPTTAEAPSALSPPMYPLGGPFKRGWKQSKMKHILCKERKKEYWYRRKLNCLHWLVFTRLVQIWTPATCTQQARPKICFFCFDLYQIFDLNHFRRASNWVWSIFDWYCQSKYVYIYMG